MRLWSLHPKYLDAKGLVALWREALLAQAVLRGETQGYRNHPQLTRFKQHADPLATLSFYLAAVHAEALRRGYRFDRNKFTLPDEAMTLTVTTGQLAYEWAHLQHKLVVRAPELLQKWHTVTVPEAHPLFVVCPGEIEPWERP